MKTSIQTIGNSKTVIVACLSPKEENLATLDNALKGRKIKTVAKKNVGTISPLSSSVSLKPADDPMILDDSKKKSPNLHVVTENPCKTTASASSTSTHPITPESVAVSGSGMHIIEDTHNTNVYEGSTQKTNEIIPRYINICNIENKHITGYNAMLQRACLFLKQLDEDNWHLSESQEASFKCNKENDELQGKSDIHSIQHSSDREKTKRKPLLSRKDLENKAK